RLAKTDTLLADHRRNALTMGGTALPVGEGLLEPLPLDDAESFEKANPLRDGKFSPDNKTIEDRRRTIVRLLAADEDACSVMALGGGHDLAPQLPDGWLYLRVSVRALDGK